MNKSSQRHLKGSSVNAHILQTAANPCSQLNEDFTFFSPITGKIMGGGPASFIRT